MFRAQTMAALRRLVTERAPDDPSTRRTVHDLRVSIRGVSTMYERRIAYLAKTPDNAWAEVDDQLRDAEVFLAACDHALEELPSGIEETPFIARIADLRRGDGWLRPESELVLFFVTAHDDSGPEPSQWLETLDAWNGRQQHYTGLSVLVDERPPGPSAPSAGGACGLFNPTYPPPLLSSVPRLVALMSSRVLRDHRLALVCDDTQDLGALLDQSSSFSDGGCLPSRPEDATCMVLVAPPVSGDDTLCARPELGLAPASADARRYAASRDVGSQLVGRPLCQMIERATCDGTAGEGFCWHKRSERSCGFSFSAWATPVNDSYVLLHCTAPRCAGGG